MLIKTIMTVALALSGLTAVHAQTAPYPNRPVTILVTTNPGGNPDTAARIVANQLSLRTGMSFVVENKPGASGSIGAAMAAKAAGDGYTLALLESTQLSLNPHLYPKLPYTAVRDFVPIVELVNVPTVLAVNNNLPVNSLSELVSYAKARPNALNYGSSGSGSVHHLTMVAFMRAAGITMTHIPYKGSAQTVPALVAGDIQAAFLGIPNVRDLAASGRVKLLASSAAERIGAMPTIATVKELGYPDIDMASRLGLFAPVGVPAEVKARIFAEVKKVLAEPEVQKKMEGLGMSVSRLDAAQFAAALEREATTLGAMARELSLKAD